jgi:DNA-binding SARP family transcriptional activator
MLLPPCCRDVENALQKCFAHRVEFAVLGPVEVWIDGRALSLGGPKQRALLALLLLNRNQVVSRDRLIDSLWGERAPASAQRSLDTYVSRLRGSWAAIASSVTHRAICSASGRANSTPTGSVMLEQDARLRPR